MKKLKFLLLFLLVISQSLLAQNKFVKVEQVADRYIENLFSFYPEWSTFYGYSKANNRLLSDISPTGISKQYKAENKLYKSLLAINNSQLSNDDQITYGILQEELESSIGTRVCKKHLWSIHQMDGFHAWFRYVANTQPVGTLKNKNDALARWKRLEQYINQDIENNRKGLNSGFALPEVVIKRVIEQFNLILKQPVKENMFYIPATKTDDVKFKQELLSIIETTILPKLSEYKQFLKGEYLPKARKELSIIAIPNGKECYEASLRQYTTLSDGPQAVFEWGEEAIAIRENKIIEIGKQVYTKNNLTEIKSAFKADNSNYFESKDELLDFVNDAVNRADRKKSTYTNLIPAANVIVEPISPEEEKSGYSRYLPASDDGSRPATYIQQTYLPEEQTKGVVESTAFHETYPGHHHQIAVQRELVKSHAVTKYIGNSGFSEGWARYTETLSDEIGLYSSEKNRLAMYMGLPTGMVVDPGIHYKNWTREQAINYTLSKQTSMTRQQVERYVDRISVLPGQMTTYGVGEMYFLKLRESAKQQYGTKFDIKVFHDNCLKYGSVPLNFLNTKMDAWLQSKRE